MHCEDMTTSGLTFSLGADGCGFSVVLPKCNSAPPSKFPALMTAAFEALGVHPEETPSTGTELEVPVRTILGGALQIVLGINELRGTHGTGHGRAEPSLRLGQRQVRLAAGAGVTVAIFLLDTLDDPSAAWRHTGPE
jgi:hypothetical protein